MVHTMFHDFIKNLALIFPAFLFLFTLKGFIKAAITRVLGDRTAQLSGFLTLNPIAHSDVWGTLAFSSLLAVLFFDNMSGMIHLMLALFFIFLFALMGLQWHYVVPVDPDQFKQQALGVWLLVLSGPCAHFLFVSGIILAVKYVPALFASGPVLIAVVHLVNLIIFFGILDLIPLPPFEGARLLPVVFGRKGDEWLAWLENYSLIIFFGIILFPGTSDILHWLSNTTRMFLFRMIW